MRSAKETAMKTNLLRLDHILDIERWQTLQDSLALVTNLAIITVDYRGIPLTRHSSCRPFCKHVREHPELHTFCEKCDSRGGLESTRISHPYIYMCHCKIVDVAIPIIVENQYVGAIMAGQIRLSDADEELEQIIHSPAGRLFDTPELNDRFAEIPYISYAELQVRVQMLFDLCNYIVKEAMNKNIILEMYEKIAVDQPIIGHVDSADTIKRIRHELGNALTSVYIESTAREPSACANPVLRPVFEFLQEHRNQTLSQKKAAELCHISSGYFSRLFTRETGERYTDFCARQKIEWAKKLLSRTDLPISQISDELGFNEPSYFIKVFRKFEGVSPSAYRKLPADE